jgi:hypothetical protein
MRERMPAGAASDLAKSTRCRDFAEGVGTRNVPDLRHAGGASNKELSVEKEGESA